MKAAFFLAIGFALVQPWNEVSAQLTQPQEAPPPQDAAQFPAPEAHRDSKLTHTIIDAPNGTFGYDILSDERLLIHQTNLPGQPGVEGCRTREDAERLAVLVINKVQKGEMPPTVTTEELKALGLVR